MPLTLTRRYYKASWKQSWSEYFLSFLPGQPVISYLISIEMAVSTEDGQIKDFYLHLSDDLLKISLTSEQIEKILTVRSDQGYKFIIKFANGYLNYDPRYNCLVSTDFNFSQGYYLFYDQDLKNALREYYQILIGKEYRS